MSIQWTLSFAATQSDEVYLDWLQAEPSFDSQVQYGSASKLRIGSFSLEIIPATDDPIWADDFEQIHGFRFTHDFYCSRATREPGETYFEVLTLAMRFLRDFPDDALLRANDAVWWVRKCGALAVDRDLFAKPAWATFLRPPHWDGEVTTL